MNGQGSKDVLIKNEYRHQTVIYDTVLKLSLSNNIPSYPRGELAAVTDISRLALI
jgi:hypothetical protein